MSVLSLAPSAAWAGFIEGPTGGSAWQAAPRGLAKQLSCVQTASQPVRSAQWGTAHLGDEEPM